MALRHSRRENVRIRDGHRQNEMGHVIDVKSGPLRWFAMRLSLAAVGWLAKYWHNEGVLAGIASIHYARWAILPGNRLLFVTNYDGTWEHYLGEFVDHGAPGLSAVWSNTKEFPRTKLLVGAGGRDEQAFKRWARHKQCESVVWYSAYPHLSIQNVLRNEELRKGLVEGLRTEKDIQKWLSLI